MRRILRIEIIGLLVSMTLLGCAGRSVPVSISTEQGRAPRAQLAIPEATTPEELAMPEAVAPEERMKAYPSPGEQVAFSLNIAQTLITREAGQKNYRLVNPDIYNLGGITEIHGLVHDRLRRDLILVGKYDPERQPLTLDDFAVALRARFIHGKWPLLSIDPTEQTEATAMQTVRTEGGIEDTQFGADMFDADHRLKRIGMGLLPADVPGLKTYWDLSEERARQGQGGSHKISSRFWFYPVLPNVSVREDVVAVQGLKVGVFTEVLSAEIDGKKIEDLSTFQDAAGDSFAREVSEHFNRLAKRHGSFSRVHGLDELVALTHALEQMEERPDLTFWLNDYRVKPVKTPRIVKVLKRQEQYAPPAAGGYYQSYRELSGGVQLMAIALRLKAGDVTALKEAVLTTRPNPDALSWSFVVGEWLIPTSPGMLKMEDIVPLFAQALFLTQKKYYDNAITLYDKLIELKPDFDWAYVGRGSAYNLSKGGHEHAISDCSKALEINARLDVAYICRAAAYVGKGAHDQAISDLSKALEINPRLAGAYTSRAAAYIRKGAYDQAISDYSKALQLTRRDPKVFRGRGLVYTKIGQYDQAIADFSHALEIDAKDAEAYSYRGATYALKGEYGQASYDCSMATGINPNLIEAYMCRGSLYAFKGEYDQVIAEFNKTLEVGAPEIDPFLALIYTTRGQAYGLKDQWDQTLSDCSKAMEIDPNFAQAYLCKAAAYGHKREHDLAIAELNKVLRINPQLADAHFYRAGFYWQTEEYHKAWNDVYKAQSLGFELPPGFLAGLRKASGRQK